MKTLPLSLAIAGWLCAAPAFALTAGASAQQPPPEEVTVRRLDVPLPHAEDKRESFLWDHFANKPEEEKFSIYRAENWKTNFDAFAKVLGRKADAQKLHSATLRKALDLVLADAKDEMAYLPVGAYETTLDGSPVWIIAVKWETLQMPEPFLVHIRIFAFDQASLTRVAFCTCM